MNGEWIKYVIAFLIIFYLLEVLGRGVSLLILDSDSCYSGGKKRPMFLYIIFKLTNVGVSFSLTYLFFELMKEIK